MRARRPVQPHPRRAQEARRQSDQAPARVPGNTVLAVDAHLERFFK